MTTANMNTTEVATAAATIDPILVEQAQESGDLRNDMSAETLVLPLRNLVSWTTFWYRPGGDLTLEEVASLMQRIFLEGALSK